MFPLTFAKYSDIVLNMLNFCKTIQKHAKHFEIQLKLGKQHQKHAKNMETHETN
jgi:hypothetical protein